MPYSKKLREGYANGGNLKRSQEWLDKMVKDGLRPDVVVYTQLLKACVLTREAIIAEEVLHRLLSDSLVPDTVVLKTLAKAVGKERCAQLCRKLDVDAAE